MTEDEDRIFCSQPGLNPWFVNFGGSRVRGASVSNFSFSPTGKGSYHVPEKFAKLEIIGKDDAGGKGAR